MKKSTVFTESCHFEDTMLNDLATRVRTTKYGTINIFQYAARQQVDEKVVEKFLGSSIEDLIANVYNTHEHCAKLVWLGDGRCVPMFNEAYIDARLATTPEQFIHRFVASVIQVCDAMPKFKERDILLTDYYNSDAWKHLKYLVSASIIDPPENLNLLRELRMGVDLTVPKNTKVNFGKILYQVTDDSLEIFKPVKKTYKLMDLQ